ncbi:MAG TPA: hypothetical protein VMW17_15965 [Candidatus Binatia bacterium]|nr:hypothetical protein [Candidatus Binatia bacterium]
MSTRLLQYAGDPADDQLDMLIEQVAHLVSMNRHDTHVEVVIGGGREAPKLTRLTDALIMLQRVARDHVSWTIH